MSSTRYLLTTKDDADLNKLARQIEGIGGEILQTMPIIKVISFLADAGLIPRIKAMPDVVAVAEDREVQAI